MAIFEDILLTLTDNINKRGKAMLALSGGSTPLDLYEKLSKQDLDWSKVTVTLIDDRLVPADHEDSNQRLVRLALLKNAASKAKLIPLEEWPQDQIPDVGVLGMGLDGHVASLFPAMMNNRLAFDPNASPAVIITPPFGQPRRARITMTLSMILAIPYRVLIVLGEEKISLLNSKFNNADVPVTRLLSAGGTLITHKKY